MLSSSASDSREKSVTNSLQKGAWLLILSGLGVCVYTSCRMAFADYLFVLDTPTSVASAVRLEPKNADYHALLAEHLEGAGASPLPELSEAIALSPLTSRYLTRAALRAEVDKDYTNTAELLVRATQADKKFAPLWALLNYYFRRGSETGVWPPEFWPVFSRALAMSAAEDSDGVFQLAWQKTDDANEILAKVPPDVPLRIRYLRFLLSSKRLPAAGVVALDLASRAEKPDLEWLVIYCERAQRVDTPAAVAVWNRLVLRGLIAGNQLNPEAGSILTNKNFAINNPPQGFDWRIPTIDGISVAQAPDGHGLTVRFDGGEPEDCTLLTQFIPLIAGREFELSYRYTTAASAFNGVRWEIVGRDGTMAASSDLSAAEGDGQLRFHAEDNWGELRLRYHRPLGSVRAEGTIVIRDLADRTVKTSAK